MLGNVALYLANRATGGAVGGVARWAAWGAFAAFFAALALVFGVVAAFCALEPRFGAVVAAAIVAAGCFAAALLLLLIPFIQDVLERRRAEAVKATDGPVATAVSSVKSETQAAVDYFGPLQIVASAFLVGMRTGRQLKAARAR